MGYTLTCNRGYLDPEDRISLEKLIGKGRVIRPPFSFKLPRLYLNLSSSLECLTKGVTKRNPLNES